MLLARQAAELADDAAGQPAGQEMDDAAYTRYR
jgi:hypothetical protein